MADAAAAVDRDAGGFVDNQQAFVLVKHVVENGRRPVCRRCGALRAQANRRDTNLVAGLEAVVRPHPAAVDTHFAAPEQPVNAAPRHTGQFAVQEIIDALAGALGVNANLSYSAGAGTGLLHRLFLHDQ